LTVVLCRGAAVFVLAGFALLAGCGVPAGDKAYGPAATVAGRDCGQPARLGVGAAIAPWRLGAVGTAEPGVLEQVAATSVRDVWAVGGQGALLATANGGRTWTAQPVPGPVMAVAGTGGWLWSLACPAAGGSACRPELARMRLPAGRWQRSPLPLPPLPDTTLLTAQHAAFSGQSAAVAWSAFAPGADAVVAGTTDAGQAWAVRRAPPGPGGFCQHVITGLTAAGTGTWWLLCTGVGAAGHDQMALMRSGDAGHTWVTMSAVTNLTAPARPGSLPAQRGTIAAGSASRLWLVTQNGLAESGDGGVTWTRVPGVNPEGGGSFDVLSPARAWLLAPGTGLWATANGLSWHALGSTYPW
jgi:photosystem II stability/assembly factor-like uncharacterized protein